MTFRELAMNQVTLGRNTEYWIKLTTKAYTNAWSDQLIIDQLEPAREFVRQFSCHCLDQVHPWRSIARGR